MTMHRPTLVALAAALLLGCPQSSSSDGTATADESGTGESTGSTSNPMTESLSNSASNSETEPDPTTETTLTTDPDSSSTDPTGTETTTGGDECTEKDECIVDEDCLLGQSCTGCLCFGEPKGGCAEWAEEGAYGNCVEDGNGACEGGGGGCLGAGEGVGVCFFSDCETPCDCPQPPKGFEEQVQCESISAGDMSLDCFIGCGNGLDCPEGMGCVQGTLCMFGVEMGLPPYADCVNEPGAMCEDGFCLVDNLRDPTFGTCADACEDAADCVVPETGDVAPVCNEFNGGVMLCQLDCTPQDTCPDGMECQFGYCGWAELPPPPPPYGDCENNPPEDACIATDTCVEAKAGSFCAGACDVVGDCAAAPPTGTAPVTCGDLGNGDVCYLSCAAAETCPDGMVCAADTNCVFPPA